MGGPVHNVQYGTGHQISHPPALQKCYAQKHGRPPPPPQARTTPSGIHPIGSAGQSILNRQKPRRMRKRQLPPRRPAEPPEADSRAWVKSHLYWVAQTSSDLELLRDFPEVHDNAGGVGQSELETQLQEAKQQRQDDSILRAHDSKVESAFGSMKSAHAPRRKLVVSG